MVFSSGIFKPNLDDAGPSDPLLIYSFGERLKEALSLLHTGCVVGTRGGGGFCCCCLWLTLCTNRLDCCWRHGVRLR